MSWTQAAAHELPKSEWERSVPTSVPVVSTHSPQKRHLRAAFLDLLRRRLGTPSARFP
jgi:hypothetical protein